MSLMILIGKTLVLGLKHSGRPVTCLSFPVQPLVKVASAAMGQLLVAPRVRGPLQLDGVGAAFCLGKSESPLPGRSWSLITWRLHLHADAVSARVHRHTHTHTHADADEHTCPKQESTQIDTRSESRRREGLQCPPVFE